MSQFRDAYRAMVLDTLKCACCGATNRPGIAYVEIDDTGSRAYCTVCSASGPLAAFKPKGV